MGMKKIAVIADGWKKFINYAWLGGCKAYIKEHNLDVNIYSYNSFGNLSKDEKTNIGEYNIFELPNFEDFDGIILELTNVSIPEVKEKLIKRVIDSGVPAVSMVEYIPGLYYSGISNYQTMEKLVEHVIKKHGARTLNFVGGPVDNSENQERFRAFSDVLQKYGIACEEKRVIHADFELKTGEVAYHHFKDLDLLPDAFICSNDNIAVGLCHEAQLDGKTIPDDFIITGFDDYDKASYYEPRITTAGFEREEIAYRAMEILVRIWNGESPDHHVYSNVKLVFQDSCGCKRKMPDTRSEYVVKHIFEEEQENETENELLDLKRALVNCETFDEIKKCLPKHLTMLNSESIYVVMNKGAMEYTDDDNSSQYRVHGYPDDMVVTYAEEDGSIVGELMLENGHHIPNETKEGGNIYLFFPVHFRDQEIGYLLLKNCYSLMDTKLIFEIMSVLMDTIEHMYHRINLSRMNRELSTLYLLDSMTGLYNRMAYTKLALPLYESCEEEESSFMAMFIDLDDLKYVNDNFGHDMGNVAIATVSAAIKHYAPKNSVAMRYGGDEFVLLAKDVTEADAKNIKKKIEDRIKKQGEALHLKFTLGVSVGYVVGVDHQLDLNDYINQADEKMYQVKKEKKAKKSC